MAQGELPKLTSGSSMFTDAWWMALQLWTPKLWSNLGISARKLGPTIHVLMGLGLGFPLFPTSPTKCCQDLRRSSHYGYGSKLGTLLFKMLGIYGWYGWNDMQNAGDLWMIYWDIDEMICKILGN
jgi:hypothetical protein